MMATALLLIATPLSSQILIVDDDFEGELRNPYADFELTIPLMGEDDDQDYLPIGEGILPLTLLGGAYLLTKRKKNKN